MLNVVYKMLVIHLGAPPNKFTWQIRDKKKNFLRFENLTPQSFLHTLLVRLLHYTDYMLRTYIYVRIYLKRQGQKLLYIFPMGNPVIMFLMADQFLIFRLDNYVLQFLAQKLCRCESHAVKQQNLCKRKVLWVLRIFNKPRKFPLPISKI